MYLVRDAFVFDPARCRQAPEVIRLNNWLLLLWPLVPRTFDSDPFYDFICRNWILGFCVFAEDSKVQ